VGNSDLKLVDGTWVPTSVITDEEVDDCNKFLAADGWEEFIFLGSIDDEAFPRIRTWRKRYEQGNPYLMEISDSACASHYMVVSSLPELMDVLARWAPVIQAGAIGYLIGEACSGSLSNLGSIEQIGARLSYGADVTRSAMENELAEQRRRQAASRVARNAQSGS
jgi:hypothetical protein